jgi:hypothetical protein
MRSLQFGVVLAGLGLGGCHQKVSAWVPPPMVPVALLDVPRDDKTVLSPPPVEDLPAVPVASAAESMRSPVRRRSRTQTTTPAPGTPGAIVVEPTTDAPDADEAVGALTTEEDTTPLSRQVAVELIGSTDQRLKGLAVNLLTTHRTQIGRIRNFQRQAQRALDSGDATGANTLATKAKLLLDDLTK